MHGDSGSESSAADSIASASADPKAAETATNHGDAAQTYNSINSAESRWRCWICFANILNFG